ncbi:putative N-acetyltransferase [Mycobacterium simulans]|uniref:Putative N-acetyltransferase n=1 Tax=Mycobacterium simulans TaxID=627089 RepID=A0A7Z7ILM7_9MYCO|nr:GNAT family N-acetyltransferase [Mycobacterium simulans]SOJ54594.1 putative N-acetyltransferase [Mycobacterium simulans]SON62286.1 putative N-acetyltransferase [Mycobacterium simulans]
MRNGIFELTVYIATTDSVDIDELAAVAACTFPLACPPGIAEEHVSSFIDAHLSPTRFVAYLSDPRHAVIIARHDRRIIGYAMLIRDDSGHSAELSKLYVVPDFHGTKTATKLMDAALAVGADWDLDYVWLGVNQKNQRAQRFYTKSGFTINGTRTFQLGTHLEDDYVMRRALRPAAECHADVTLGS